MIYLPVILLAIIGLLVSLYFTKFLIGFLSKRGVFDIPNERSSHSRPVPRGGGIAIICGFLASIFVVKMFFQNIPVPGVSFFLGIIVLMAVGFLDDKFTISALTRFIIHIVAVGLVLFETGGFTAFPLPEPFSFPLIWLGLPLSFFWILAVMNIYNFLDGIDGYAGAQAVVAGLSFAILDFGGTGMIVGICLAFSSFGFLIFNWHPAKIFMGDVGSITLGFIFATLPLYLNSPELYIGNFAAIIILWFFISDGSFTIIKRILERKKIWQAHREHLYQIWVIKGVKPNKIVVEIMSYYVILIGVFLLLYFYAFEWLGFSFVLGLLMFIIYTYRVKRYHGKKRI